VTQAALDGRIVVDDLTKVFRGKIRAVDRLTFTVEPGSVTGFLGPNGAGKTTTLRMVLGLVHPTAGQATIGGLPYHRLHNPTLVVGAGARVGELPPGSHGAQPPAHPLHGRRPADSASRRGARAGRAA
jgi:energy-coupling factor transporter ATP-binding protein EcfA2